MSGSVPGHPVHLLLFSSTVLTDQGFKLLLHCLGTGGCLLALLAELLSDGAKFHASGKLFKYVPVLRIPENIPFFFLIKKARWVFMIGWCLSMFFLPVLFSQWFRKLPILREIRDVSPCSGI